jgi:hypothetical protein
MRKSPSLARNAQVHDFDWLALADLREARVTAFGRPVARIRPNPVGHLAKSLSGLAKGKARKDTEKRAVYEASLPLCHTTPGRPIGEARFPEMGAEGSSRWQAFAHEEQAILAGAWVAHESDFRWPELPNRPEWVRWGTQKEPVPNPG